MSNEKVFAMRYAKVFPLLIAKAERKGRSREEVLMAASWLTGYSADAMENFLSTDLTYGDFFRHAPAMHANRAKITGSVCGVKLSEIDDPLMLELRRLDKLVDELAKGWPMEKILRS